MARRNRVDICDRPSSESATILLPVLNEAERLGPCLESLIAQPSELREILVIDGGSVDGTRDLVNFYCRRDPRIRLVDATPVDAHWTGKAWGLYRGLDASGPQSVWIVCLDADARVSPFLIRSLLAHAQQTGVGSFSLATSQHVADHIDALLHPAMLTTLVYRFGRPGRPTRNLHRVQGNGQCFMSRRDTLVRSGAFRAAQQSLSEDITIVRRLAECGEAVGFYESDHLVDVQMYGSWRETWSNWPRSLPMRDQYFGWREAGALIALLFVQALPLPLLVLGLLLDLPLWLVLVAGLLLSIRLGVLFGTARAYPKRPWTYWLSPICDLPVVLRILHSALTRRQRWRGRTYVRRKGGIFEPV